MPEFDSIQFDTQQAAAAPKSRRRFGPRRRAEAEAKAAKGILPAPPDFSAATHARFRGRLAKLIALAEAGNLEGLKAIEIKPYSSSRKALARYRDLCIAALEARA